MGKVRYTSDWINKLESEGHWRAYWMQQKLISEFVNQKDSILEIGVGSGFCANYLKSRGFKVETLDIDPVKKPDVIADITEKGFSLGSEYDAILLFEVLEHIPFENLRDVLSNLQKHLKGSLILSIPESRARIATVKFKIPFIPNVDINWHVSRARAPFFLKKRCKLAKNHHWELNYDERYLESDILKVFSGVGLQLEKKVVSQFNNHHYYVFSKVKSK